ncbi:hypothetical protein Q4S45_19650 [Massilia sp. R2A-15]|uniref:hypothetical protein n=1 Tax=Massilia sp. R2A-15 TaxID=3064278 RepID=UPI0027376FEE|nr:hypothetical protein [Massilia sp. R2A-15]WLI88893.1 hypothetical protein Q4S45_19650 [Massilia sp. R2A-15]
MDAAMCATSLSAFFTSASAIFTKIFELLRKSLIALHKISLARLLLNTLQGLLTPSKQKSYTATLIGTDYEN